MSKKDTLKKIKNKKLKLKKQGGTIMEKLSNKGLVTVILGALMMGSVVVQCVSHIIDAILIF